MLLDKVDQIDSDHYSTPTKSNHPYSGLKPIQSVSTSHFSGKSKNARALVKLFRKHAKLMEAVRDCDYAIADCYNDDADEEEGVDA